MKKLLLIFSFSLLSFTLQAQYEAAHWFFGTHAGLDFSGGAPVREPGGQIDTEEGCSSISNACGDLLLYTDGITIWNANHQVMQNGTGLHGDASSTQSGIVVPKPGDRHIYYVFTVDDAFGGPSTNGMQYSEVDMTLDGGLGGVVAGKKNIQLVNSASEKVTAVISSDGSSVWVITTAPRTTSTSAPYTTIGDNMNTFYAFRITSSGVSNTATVSQLPLNIFYGIGYLKASPDGTKIAMANAMDNTAYLFDFDNATGVVSNPTQLSLNMGNDSPYGLEFSPDSSKLYLSDWYDRLTQFDLSNNNQATIISTNTNYRAALQLGLDGKIYRPYTTDYGSNQNTVSVIENPNEAGTACNYRHRYINLGSGMYTHQGLPPFIQSYFVQIQAPNVTAQFNNTWEVTSNEEIVSVDWDFGDGTSATSYPDNPPDNTHSQTNHTYSTPGNYTIVATLHLFVGCDVSVTQVFIIPPDVEVAVCGTNLSGIETLDLHQFDNDVIANQPNPGSFEIHYFLNESDALNDVNEITGLYTNSTNHDKLTYKLINLSNNDIFYGTFYLNINPMPEILQVSDYEICDVDSDGIATFDLSSKLPEILGSRGNPPYEVNFYPTQTDAEAGTNEITDITNYTNETAFDEVIWYKITDTDSGCTNTGSFNLKVHPLPEINMDDTYLFCIGSSIQIDAPAGFASYEWSTGETTRDILVNTAGNYTLTVTDDNGCTNSKIITVDASDVAVIDDIIIKDFNADNNQITVLASGIGDYEYSIDGINYQDSNVFDHLYPGTYTVYISDKNACGVVSQDVDLLGAPRFFTPNGDGFNDFWQIINITKKPASVIGIYDRYGKLLTTLTSDSKGWDGTLNGRQLPATDYWFVANVNEANGKVRKVTGHFALKR